MPVKNLSTLLLITLLLASCTTNHSKQPIKQLPSDNLTTKKNIETKEPHHKINWLNKKPFPQALKKAILALFIEKCILITNMHQYSKKYEKLKV